MIQVVSLELGVAVLLTVGKVIAGDEMEAPGAELTGIVELSSEQKI